MWENHHVHVYPSGLRELEKNIRFILCACLASSIFPLQFFFFFFFNQHIITLTSALLPPHFIFTFKPPSDLAPAHQYWTLSPLLMRAILSLLHTLACLYHRADEINSPGSALRKPIFTLRERTHHSKWPSFEWAVQAKLLSYCFIIW